MKKVLFILVLAGVAAVLWFSFALWTGLYGVYSYPPSKDHPDGTTLIVNREEGEPTYNSPHYTPPPPKPPERTGGIAFGSIPRKKKPVEERTIIELPYIEWAYKKSLEPSPAQ